MPYLQARPGRRNPSFGKSSVDSPPFHQQAASRGQQVEKFGGQQPRASAVSSDQTPGGTTCPGAVSPPLLCHPEPAQTTTHLILQGFNLQRTARSRAGTLIEALPLGTGRCCAAGTPLSGNDLADRQSSIRTASSEVNATSRGHQTALAGLQEVPQLIGICVPHHLALGCQMNIQEAFAEKTPVNHQHNAGGRKYYVSTMLGEEKTTWRGETHGGLAAHSLLCSGTPTIPNGGQSTPGEACMVGAHHPGRGQTIPADACLLEPQHPGPHSRRSPSPFPAPRGPARCRKSAGGASHWVEHELASPLHVRYRIAAGCKQLLAATRGKREVAWLSRAASRHPRGTAKIVLQNHGDAGLGPAWGKRQHRPHPCPKSCPSSSSKDKTFQQADALLIQPTAKPHLDIYRAQDREAVQMCVPLARLLLQQSPACPCRSVAPHPQSRPRGFRAVLLRIPAPTTELLQNILLFPPATVPAQFVMLTSEQLSQLILNSPLLLSTS
ncbi:hypothetical protein Anapl_08946 [Anas platyrhynchos]|uniref:Uncharacterized protein n=1 Tax=Anas platyrhynchos TaxID=8839 RepID=R0JLC7_ANAPL|nr:hypothetical protein Anapl_08946 [Anas platyrhynchos]